MSAKKRHITFLFSIGKVHFQQCMLLCWIIPDTPTQSCDLPQISTDAWNRFEQTCAAAVVKREKHILCFTLYIAPIAKLVHRGKEKFQFLFSKNCFYFSCPVHPWQAACSMCVSISCHCMEDLSCLGLQMSDSIVPRQQILAGDKWPGPLLYIKSTPIMLGFTSYVPRVTLPSCDCWVSEFLFL